MSKALSTIEIYMQVLIFKMKVLSFLTKENQYKWYDKTIKKKPQSNLLTKSHINQLVFTRK